MLSMNIIKACFLNFKQFSDYENELSINIDLLSRVLKVLKTLKDPGVKVNFSSIIYYKETYLGGRNSNKS